MSLPLFGYEEEAPPQAARLASALHRLTERGIYVGTSSWKYEGWIGHVYSRELYLTRGKFSRAKFEAECLKEYALTFPVVCGDFSFYQFPAPEYWDRLFRETPESLLFSFKVPEDVTVLTWPGHARYGTRAGLTNEHFLDANLFERAFARPLIPYRDRVAALIFEFGTFSRREFPYPEDFVGRLDAFLGSLPPGYRYSVEVRNPEFLTSAYFEVLAHHGAAHVFNAWTRMPTLSEQIELPGAYTAGFTVVRSLLRKGRTYEQAVKRFEPYREIQEPDVGTRDALRRVVARAMRDRILAYVFINNRLEGNAPGTIEAVVLDEDS